MCELSSLCPFSPDELTVYKVQHLQWTADFSGDITLTWMRPKKMPSASCVYNVYYRWVLLQGGSGSFRLRGPVSRGREWVLPVSTALSPGEGVGPPRLQGPVSLRQKAALCCAGKGSVHGGHSPPASV